MTFSAEYQFRDNRCREHNDRGRRSHSCSCRHNNYKVTFQRRTQDRVISVLPLLLNLKKVHHVNSSHIKSFKKVPSKDFLLVGVFYGSDLQFTDKYSLKICFICTLSILQSKIWIHVDFTDYWYPIYAIPVLMLYTIVEISCFIGCRKFFFWSTLIIRSIFVCHDFGYAFTNTTFVTVLSPMNLNQRGRL